MDHTDFSREFCVFRTRVLLAHIMDILVTISVALYNNDCRGG